MDYEREHTCFFTGHRWIPSENSQNLISRVDRVIKTLSSAGYQYFICGGAVGFDTLAACRVIVAMRRIPEIKLILALPCRDQTLKWRRTYDISLYQRIKGYASDIIYTSDVYSPDCMHKRNKFMADMSSVCIACYNGSPGGTAYTVKYARDSGIRVINVYKGTEFMTGI